MLAARSRPRVTATPRRSPRWKLDDSTPVPVVPAPHSRKYPKY
jgi:hypothetical protein